MDTIKLHYFSTVAKTENLRKAAELLKVTPSTLSKTVKLLEEEFGVPLVIPLGRGITLTPEGKKLAQEATGLLDSYGLLGERIRGAVARPEFNPLRIATFEVFSTYFLQALEQVEFGDRGLLLHEVVPGELEHAIEQGKADFGITYLPIAHPALEHVKVTSILMGVYKRKGTFRNSPQEKLPFVVPALPLSGAATRVKGLDGWPEDAYRRVIKYEVTLLESALELCRQGKCVGYFPSFIVDRQNRRCSARYQLERHPYEKGLRRCYSEVYLVRRRDRPEDKDLRLVAKLIRMGVRMDRED
jgi:DNA-binding transcriptional LysR family regulator